MTELGDLVTFKINLKETQRRVAQKFSRGDSVTGQDEIIIQGDFPDKMIDVTREQMARGG